MTYSLSHLLLDRSSRLFQMIQYGELTLFPAKHYITAEEKRMQSITHIRIDLEERLEELRKENKIVEAHRLEKKTNYDLEMIETIGYCEGIENYSRYFDGRGEGEAPYSLIDYFSYVTGGDKGDFLVIVDESHITIPQIRGMYHGDRSRKQNLIDYGFRLPSALDNRPLKFDEFERLTNKVVYTSATPGIYEKERSLIEAHKNKTDSTHY